MFQRYRLEVAFDLFYNDQLAQLNAERSLQSRSKAIAEAFETVLNAQFNDFQGVWFGESRYAPIHEWQESD
jgi:hypothetical protein